MDIPEDVAQPGAEPEHTTDQSQLGVFKHILAQHHVRALLTSAFMLSLTAVGFDVVFVLYCYTDVQLGGMGRSVGVSQLCPGSLGSYTCS